MLYLAKPRVTPDVPAPNHMPHRQGKKNSVLGLFGSIFQTPGATTGSTLPKLPKKLINSPCFPSWEQLEVSWDLTRSIPNCRSILPWSPLHQRCFQQDFLLYHQQPPTQVPSLGFFPFPPILARERLPSSMGTWAGGKGPGQAVKHTDLGNKKRFQLLQAGKSQEILRT